MNLIDEIRIAQRNAAEDAVIRNLEKLGIGTLGMRASAKDSESVVVSKATPLEQWLENELDKIDPDRHEMGSAGETGALRKLVFSMKEQLDGGAN